MIPNLTKADFNQPQGQDRLAFGAGAQKNDSVLDRGASKRILSKKLDEGYNCEHCFMDGYYPEIKEVLPHMTAEALPPPMREAYEAVAPQPANWPKLVAKAAEHASNFSGIPPEAIQAIQAPALVIVADGDIVRIEHAEELARLLRTELVVLPDSDHVSYLLEHSDVLLSKLAAFLDAPMPVDK